MTDTGKYLTMADADKCGYSRMSAKQVAAQFGVSERTARRHIAKGTLPAADRRKASRYGKVFTVPAPGPSLRSSMCHGDDLLMARAALRRVAKRGDRFNDNDLATAKEILDELALLVGAWRSVVDDETTAA